MITIQCKRCGKPAEQKKEYCLACELRLGYNVPLPNMENKIFDPDLVQAQIDSIGAYEFGLLLAQVLAERPTSSNWVLVNQAIERKTGWSAEHDQVRNLIARIAGYTSEKE